MVAFSGSFSRVYDHVDISGTKTSKRKPRVGRACLPELGVQCQGLTGGGVLGPEGQLRLLQAPCSRGGSRGQGLSICRASRGGLAHGQASQAFP